MLEIRRWACILIFMYLGSLNNVNCDYLLNRHIQICNRTKGGQNFNIFELQEWVQELKYLEHNFALQAKNKSNTQSSLLEGTFCQPSIVLNQVLQNNNRTNFLNHGICNLKNKTHFVEMKNKTIHTDVLNKTIDTLNTLIIEFKNKSLSEMNTCFFGVATLENQNKSQAFEVKNKTLQDMMNMGLVEAKNKSLSALNKTAVSTEEISYGLIELNGTKPAEIAMEDIVEAKNKSADILSRVELKNKTCLENHTVNKTIGLVMEVNNRTDVIVANKTAGFMVNNTGLMEHNNETILSLLEELGNKPISLSNWLLPFAKENIQTPSPVTKMLSNVMTPCAAVLMYVIVGNPLRSKV